MFNLPLILVIVDFKKAFSYGISKDSQCNWISYNNTKSPVLVGDSVSKSFDVNIGVLQGDSLAPFLFVIVLDWVMRQATVDNPGFVMIPRQSRRQPEYKLSDLDYAHDIAK